MCANINLAFPGDKFIPVTSSGLTEGKFVCIELITDLDRPKC